MKLASIGRIMISFLESSVIKLLYINYATNHVSWAKEWDYMSPTTMEQCTCLHILPFNCQFVANSESVLLILNPFGMQMVGHTAWI